MKKKNNIIIHYSLSYFIYILFLFNGHKNTRDRIQLLLDSLQLIIEIIGIFNDWEPFDIIIVYLILQPIFKTYKNIIIILIPVYSVVSFSNSPNMQYMQFQMKCYWFKCSSNERLFFSNQTLSTPQMKQRLLLSSSIFYL